VITFDGFAEYNDKIVQLQMSLSVTLLSLVNLFFPSTLGHTASPTITISRSTNTEPIQGGGMS